MNQIQEGHLGGCVIGGDPATQFPQLWAWLATQGVKTILDVGCGDGTAMDTMRSLGFDVRGIEGIDFRNRPGIIHHDYTHGPWRNGPVDCVWCCEFVEHIEEKYVPNFLATFRAATKLIAMTHATVGQGGYHHVNCQPKEYWIGALAAIGYRLDDDLTNQARQQAAYNTNEWNHFVRSGMVFVPYGPNSIHTS